MSEAEPVEKPVRQTSVLGGCVRGALVLFCLLVGLGSHLLGQSYGLLVLALPLAVLATLPARLWSLVRGRLLFGFARHPLAREHRPYLWQWLLRVSTYALSVACLSMAVPRALFADATELHLALWIFGWVPAGLLVVLQSFPARHISRAVNLLHGLAAAFLALQLFQVYVTSGWATPVPLQAPFLGEWVVIQGGRSSLINHHFPLASQRYALDVIQLKNGRHVAGDPSRLTSYACFDAVLYAPADGTVVQVVDDRPDQAIGTTDAEQPVGNHVVIDLGQERFVLLAHLKQGSVLVAEGDRVQAGAPLARCGNSGNTSEPHLHLQVQNRAEFTAADLRSYPLRFENVKLLRGGASRPPGELRRNDRLLSSAVPAAD